MRIFVFVLLAFVSLSSLAQSVQMPQTVGETLAGGEMRLADVVKGHRVVLVAGFSRASNEELLNWFRQLRADAGLKGVDIYEVVELEAAPGLIRGVIKSGMRKGLNADEQAHVVVLSKEEKAWRQYFGVGGDGEPYVVVLGLRGEELWRGHGRAREGLDRVLQALR